MDILDSALHFAIDAHSGMTRKMGNTPYILHPLEVAAIAGTMTEDREVLAAAVLHDVVEDTPVTAEEIERRFGERVAALVASETEDKRPGIPPQQSWRVRKEESLQVLRETTDTGVKILWLSDKLANMRAFDRAYQTQGDALWRHFHQNDPVEQAWYYRTVAKLTEDLAVYPAWQEYHQCIKHVFGGKEHA